MWSLDEGPQPSLIVTFHERHGSLDGGRDSHEVIPGTIIIQKKSPPSVPVKSSLKPSNIHTINIDSQGKGSENLDKRRMNRLQVHAFSLPKPPPLYLHRSTATYEFTHSSRRRRRFATIAAAAASSTPLLHLPLLPFPKEQVLVPSEYKKLPLYEARYLALLEESLYKNKSLFVHFVLDPISVNETFTEASFAARYACLVSIEKVERLDIGALVFIRGIGRVKIVQFAQASEEDLLQTQTSNALKWAEKTLTIDCEEAFIPSPAERISFRASVCFRIDAVRAVKFAKREVKGHGRQRYIGKIKELCGVCQQ